MGIAYRFAASLIALFFLTSTVACSSGGGGGAGGTGGISPNPDLELTGPFAVDEAGGRIYWAVSRGIRSATLDGQDERPLFEALERAPTRLRVDSGAQRLTWTDGENVFSSDLNGGGLEPLGEGRSIDIAPASQALYVARDGQGIFVLTGGAAELVIEAPVEHDIAVSESAGKLFFIQGDAIYEAPLAGGTPSVVAGTEDSKATLLDVDPDTNDLYYRSGWETFRVPTGTAAKIQVLDRVRDPIHVDVLGGSRLYWSSREYQELWFADLTTAADTLLEHPDGMGPFTVDEAHQKLFFIASHTIHVADLDGQNAAPLLAGIDGKIERVRVDPAGQKIYVRTSNNLGRANLDGTGVELLVPNAQDGSSFIGGMELGADIALDLPNQKLYWTIEDPAQSSQHAIVRGNLDGSGATQLPGIALSSHSPIDLDGAGKIYFHSKTGLGRANLDGSGVESAPASGIGTVVGLRVDAAGQKLYILEPERLLRSDLDFQNLEVVLDLPSTTYGLSFDASTGLLYYRQTSGELHRLNVGTPGATPVQVTLPAALTHVTGNFTVTGDTLYLGTGQDHVARFDVASPTSLETILLPIDTPAAVAVIGDVLYWADSNEGWIAAADLDGKHPRLVLETPVDGNLIADPTGGGLFYTADGGLFRLNLGTGAEELDSKHLRSLTASPTDLYFIPVDSNGLAGNTPSIQKWNAGNTTQLIDEDVWYGGMPRALAWGDDRLHCLDVLGVLSTLSADGATTEPLAIVPGASKLSLRSAHFQQSTRSLYFVRSTAIQRLAVPDSPRVRLLFALN